MTSRQSPGERRQFSVGSLVVVRRRAIGSGPAIWAPFTCQWRREIQRHAPGGPAVHSAAPARRPATPTPRLDAQLAGGECAWPPLDAGSRRLDAGPRGPSRCVCALPPPSCRLAGRQQEQNELENFFSHSSRSRVYMRCVPVRVCVFLYARVLCVCARPPSRIWRRAGGTNELAKWRFKSQSLSSSICQDNSDGNTY